MSKGLLQKPWIRVVSTVLVLGIMVALFIFSGQGQEQSEGLSFPIGDAALETGGFESSVFDGVKEQYAEEGEPFWLFVQRLVRKMAHVVIFMALGGSLLICLESWLGERKLLWLWSFIGGTLYAASDEWHQSMVPSRSGSIEDVLIDAAGVAAGVLVTILVLKLIKKHVTKRRGDSSLRSE